MESWDIIIKYIFIPAEMFFVCIEHLLSIYSLCSWALPQPFVLLSAHVLLQALDSLSRVISELSDNTSEHLFPQPRRSLTGDAPILHVGSS